MDRLDRGYEIPRIGKKVTVLPSTYHGGPRYMKAREQDSLALVRELGKPTFFIKFTCNPEWQEFDECLEPGQKPEDCPDMVARVFNLSFVR